MSLSIQFTGIIQAPIIFIYINSILYKINIELKPICEINFVLSTIFLNGPNIWPGAKSIEKKNGKKYSINDNNKKDIKLELGDKVNRHIVDNDYVLFNRQPSLHKMSMMGHRVKVMEGNTFRLNISVTPPYNGLNV